MATRPAAAILLLLFTLAPGARAEEAQPAPTVDPTARSMDLARESWGTVAISSGLLGGMFLSGGIIAADCSSREFCKPNPTALILFYGGSTTTNIATWVLADQSNAFARRSSVAVRPERGIRILGNVLHALGTLSSLILFPLAYIWQPPSVHGFSEGAQIATFICGLTFSHAGTFVLLEDARRHRP